jgi:PiT family inorganic phosphate transporter
VDIALAGVIAVVVAALVFDFTNGFHDAANSVGTVVATRALPARLAPLFSAVFNFLAYFFVGTAVANTIAKTVKVPYAGVAVVFAALVAATMWNYVTWHLGMPSSSSHAVIGGLVGAGIAAGGQAAISWASVTKASVGIVASPLVALVIAVAAMYLVFGIQRVFRLRDEHPVFKGAQLVSAAAISFGHGANDAQKTMGVIAALLLGSGHSALAADGAIVVPEWVALSSYSAIAVGTLWGGWKIIETMGLRLTTLHANSGAAANIGASTAIFGATSLGVPVSTTHAAASSVVGAGISSGRGANWRVVGTMMISWAVTIPASALVAGGILELTKLPTVLAWVTIGCVISAFGSWAIWAMAHTIHAADVEAEIPSLAELDQPVEPHLQLSGHGPVD